MSFTDSDMLNRIPKDVQERIDAAQKRRVVDCQHEDFISLANITRIIDVKAFMADIRIWCAKCGTPFEFQGVKGGLSYSEPMCSIDAQELRAPIQPKGLKIFPAIKGFSVKAN